MPPLDARIAATPRNALGPTGPKAGEVKDRPRVHPTYLGRPGVGPVLPEREAAEVERRAAAFREELRPSGEVGLALARHAATMSVRMERCVAHETAALTERVRRALADFVPPEGADDAEAARLRAEAGTRAMFDPSPEATLARRYEAAAARGFFRALKELRQLERDGRAARSEADDEATRDLLGSFSKMEREDAEFDALFLESERPAPRQAAPSGISADLSTPEGRVDVPFSIGRRR